MFTDEDKALHKGLMKLLDEASFSLQAREVRAFLVIYEWTKNLPNKVEPQIKEKKPNVRNK